MKEQIKQTIEEFLKSSELIKINSTEKERRIFNDNRVFQIFSNSEKEITLTPFNDYTYEILYTFLYSLNEWLKSNEINEINDLNNFLDENFDYIVYDELIYNYQYIEYLNQYFTEINDYMQDNLIYSMIDAINLHYQELQQNLFYEYLQNIISYFEELV
jgi:hypothetical protein